MTDQELKNKTETLTTELRALKLEQIRRQLLHLADEKVERIQDLCGGSVTRETMRALAYELGVGLQVDAQMGCDG